MMTSDDHPRAEATEIWNLTSLDIERIKGQLQARRARIDAKYAEDSKALDVEFAEVETLARVAASVALRYRAEDAPKTSEDDPIRAEQNGAPVEADVVLQAQAVTLPADSGGPEPKTASRWRLAVRE